MPQRRMVVWRVAACSVLGSAVAAALASGCGGDNGPDRGDAATDAVVDQTTPDASQPDTSQPDTSRPDASQPDTSQPDVAPDTSRPDTSQPDVSVEAGDGSSNDALPDVTGADARGPDANDAASDSSDAQAPGDSGEGGACVTTAANLAADAGAPDASVAPVLLFGFDDPGGLDLRWHGYTANGVSSALLGETLSDGKSCPGALAFNLTFTAYNLNAGVDFDYGSAGVDWSGRTRLHAWIKLTTSDYAAFNGVELIIDSNNYATHRFGAFLPGTGFAHAGSDSGWREFVVNLGAAAGDYVPTNVNLINFQLQVVNSQPDGSPAAPPPVGLFVDDVWLE